MSQPKMHVRKGDTVVMRVGHGAKYGEKTVRGLRGKVLVAFPREGKVIVAGINVIKRHTKPGGAHPQGGIIEKEAPVPASKVMVVCPKCDKPTRVAHSYVSDPKRPSGQKKIRVCKKCGASLDA